MSDALLVAIITTSGIIIAAIIKLISDMVKKKSGSLSSEFNRIRQSTKGNGNLQIGFQKNTFNKEDGEKDDK